MRLLGWLAEIVGEKGITRREFLKGAGKAAILASAGPQLLLSCSRSRGKFERVILLGFDGIDPELLQSWLIREELKNLASLKEAGAYGRLKTVIPPHSPVAWPCFSAGASPGKIGIFDFIHRDPKTYFPEIGFRELSEVRLEDGKIIPPSARTTRALPTFWKIASDEGAEVCVYNIAYAFPPERIKRGVVHCGAGTPDVRNTESHFFYFCEDAEEDFKKVSGGAIAKAVFSGDSVKLKANGPINPYSAESAQMPFEFEVKRSSDSISVIFQGQKIELKTGDWSPWIRIVFRYGGYQVFAIFKFYLISLAPFKLYMSPLNSDPERPYIPFTHPPDFSAGLKNKHGYYKTVGWAYDTNALNYGALDEASFLHDMFETWRQKQKFALDLIKNGSPLFLTTFISTDRASHMFYWTLDPLHPVYSAEKAKKWGNVLLDVYKDMDRFVGEVLSGLGSRDLLIVFSDHGFESFRKGLNVNRWLATMGYLKLKDNKKFSKKEFFEDVDWSQTIAYAMGTGQIYLNLKGREREGIVEPAKAAELTQRIANNLKKVSDPKTGESIVEDVYIGQIIYGDKFYSVRPDLVIALAPGYRSSWGTPLGTIPLPLIEDNTRLWSGDHATLAVTRSHGFVLTNLKTLPQDPYLLDIAPTAFEALGLKIDEQFEGKSWLP